MPQKQPPAITAVCSPLVLATAASAVGLGTAAIVLSPAVQAIAPPSVSTNSSADMREKSVINSPQSLADVLRRLRLLRVARRMKVSRRPELSEPCGVTFAALAH